MVSSRRVLGVRIDCTSYQAACDQIHALVISQTPAYVVAANVHVVMTALWQPKFRPVLEGAALVTPDGMPLVWALRLLGVSRQTRVYGPDLLLAWCARAAQEQHSVYLYGSTEAVLAKLSANLQRQFPRLPIAGYESPPFRPLTEEETTAALERIRSARAQVLLVGLGCPKQEYWMAQHCQSLGIVALGVGAAFSFHSGVVKQAPRWMMHWGLEWLYRLTQEPGRLWQRYLINNPLFLVLFLSQLLRGWLRLG